MIGYYVLIGLTMLTSWLVGRRLKSKFKEYAQIPIGLSGKEIAERMLSENGITDVQVTAVPGALTDHYNPAKKTVNLSEWVYNERTVSAAAVAAHECGHAVQHAQAYKWLGMRSKLVPMVNIGGRFSTWIIFAGIALYASQGIPYVGIIGIALFGLTTLFAFVTLPVEFDASNRALVWINNSGVMSSQQHDKAKDALKWAAMTYVVAALASLAQLGYWVLRMMSSRR